MTLRVAVLHQGFIPPYRVRFYELLNQRAGAEYVVFHGAPPSDTGSLAATGPFSFPNRPVRNREIRIGRWAAIYQPVLRDVLSGGFDAVVLGHEIKFLSNLALAALCGPRDTAVLFWGFGYHVKIGLDLGSEAQGWVTASAGFIKDRLVRLADGYLAYTNGGVDRLCAIGFPRDHIYVLRNTIDVTEQIKLYDQFKAADPLALRRELGLLPDSVVLMFIGRLLEPRRADLLIEAARRINEGGLCPSFVEAIVIGSGPMADSLRRQGEGVPGVRLLGDIRDQSLIAKYMKVAAAVVIPGLANLAVNHAFAQGRPVITRQHDQHGPEVEYIVDGGNGLIVGGGVDEFVDALARFAASPEQQRRLTEGTLETRKSLRMEMMAERFDEAVRDTVDRKRAADARKRTAA